jgi:hypothetical protein
MTESTVPEKKSKPELEQLIKANGGKIFQSNTAAANMFCIAERSIFSSEAYLLPMKSTKLRLPRNSEGSLLTERGKRKHSSTVVAF